MVRSGRAHLPASNRHHPHIIAHHLMNIIDMLCLSSGDTVPFGMHFHECAFIRKIYLRIEKSLRQKKNAAERKNRVYLHFVFRFSVRWSSRRHQKIGHVNSLIDLHYAYEHIYFVARHSFLLLVHQIFDSIHLLTHIDQQNCCQRKNGPISMDVMHVVESVMMALVISSNVLFWFEMCVCVVAFAF